MGCTFRVNKFPCLGKRDSELKLSPKTFIKQRSDLIIDSYKIGKKLGAGTFGTVRLVQHKITGQKRAIKSICKNKIPKDLQLGQFLNEIEILMNSDHPHIVRLYEFFEDQKYWHLVTEYLAGGELFNFFLKSKHLNEKQASSFTGQLLRAVSYCHSNNIVHRDLKPENLLLTPDLKTLKVIDFGTSTFLSSDRILKRKHGTSYYLAPEVLKGIYDEKCDIWSIGVILYLLISGRPPFPGKKDEEILRNVEKGVFSIQGDVWKKVSPEVKDLIKRLLTYNPQLRPSANQALGHPWFSKFEDFEEVSNNLALQSLSQFFTTQKLQNAVLTFMISQLGHMEDMREASGVFQRLDRNKDGKISREELVSLYNLAGIAFLGTNVEKIIEKVDINGSGFIDYTEFLVACRKKELVKNVKDLENTFKSFDIDRNGRITAGELKEILGDGTGDEGFWSTLIREADLNGDGGIDIYEFKKMMLSLVG
jgi:calcium-dependent protein kinase